MLGSGAIARMDGVFGTVVAEGDFVGRVMLWKAAALSTAPSVPMSAHVGAYYLRLMVVDRPGVIADVTAILRDMGVSLESMLQRGRSPGEAVPVVLVTHETQESAMRWTGSVRWTQ